MRRLLPKQTTRRSDQPQSKGRSRNLVGYRSGRFLDTPHTALRHSPLTYCRLDSEISRCFLGPYLEPWITPAPTCGLRQLVCSTAHLNRPNNSRIKKNIHHLGSCVSSNAWFADKNGMSVRVRHALRLRKANARIKQVYETVRRHSNVRSLISCRELSKANDR